MTRLVVVSNRVATTDGSGGSAAAAGGLAVGILAALQENGGIWFGWNGEVVSTPPDKPEITQSGRLTFATVGLTRRDHSEYYNGFSNQALWPLFHYRLDLVHFNRRHYSGYQRVNGRLARLLFPLLREGDIIWVHDYHLIPMADELRRMGVRQPIGFFLHTPFPAAEIMLALPRHEPLIRALCAYDLVGFQTVNDLAAFQDYLVLYAGATIEPNGVIRAFGRTLRAEVFPIGVDVDNVASMAAEHEGSELQTRLRNTLRERELIVGVDRLDYSKGLVQRFQAFECLLEQNPTHTGRVIYIQVAPPSRGEVTSYAEIRQELEAAAGHLNGRFADFDWVPLRYLNRSFDRASLACFYRQARVGLVTPLRDGMNLVAKEYVAAQQPESPGVLVLSRFAGAAQELEPALLVNPLDVEGVAAALERALNMDVDERRERWQAMMDTLKLNDIHHWRQRFLSSLADFVATR